MYAGHVCSLVQNAKKLYPGTEAQPVICLESDAWYDTVMCYVKCIVYANSSFNLIL